MLLRSFPSIRRINQLDYLYKYLTQRFQTGGIQSLEDLTTQLKERVNQLAPGGAEPLFKGAKLPDYKISDPDDFNQYIDLIITDIKTLFEESTIVDNFLDTFQGLFNEEILKNLGITVNRLQKQADFLVSLLRAKHGYNQIITNTFDNPGSKLSRSAGVNELFVDWKSYGSELVVIDRDLSIDDLSGILSLPIKNYKEQIPEAIAIDFASSTGTDLGIDLVDYADPNNLLANQGWTYHIVKYKQQKDDVLLRLLITFNTTRIINAIELETLSDSGVRFHSLEYSKSDGTTEEIEVLEPTASNVNKFRLYFSPVRTNLLYLTLKQSTANRITATADAIRKAHLSAEDILKESLQRVISNESKPEEGATIDLFVYPIGLKILRILKNSYEPRGIFISTPLDIANFSSAALFVDEQYDRGNTIEYYLILKEFSNRDELLGTNIIALLPDDRSTSKEGLCFGGKTNTAFTNFSLSLSTPSDVTLYWDGVKLDSTEYALSQDRELGTGTIKLLSNQIPSLSDILVIEYTPDFKHSDLVNNEKPIAIRGHGCKKFQYNKDGAILVNQHLIPSNYDHSRIYLAIIMRSLDQDGRTTPILSKYHLLLNQYKGDIKPINFISAGTIEEVRF